MFASPVVRKFARVAVTSVTAGAALALVFLGGPADAAVLSQGRGF
jgi:hypothetical protein